MALSDLASNLARSVTGSPKKAVLYIHETSGSTKGLLGDVANMASSVLGMASDVAAATLNKGTAALGIKPRALEVQYNPASLALQANAEPIPFSYLLKNVDNGIPNQQMRPPAIALSVELLFDDTNLKDAFMAEKARMSVGDAISGVASLLKNTAGSGYSVQPQTNALVAMLMRDATRLVTFQWADLSFTGEICQIQARYTMFSVSGKPIRSAVQLVILQQITSDGDITYWDKAFDACFKDSLSGSGGAKSALQKAGNLINITGF